VIIVAILFIRQNIIRKKANNLLMLKNAEILQQKEEIETQRDEIEAQRDEITAQRDIAAEQRDLIASQKLAITDSIEYAKRIQNAVLPKNEALSKVLNEYFILFKPKDVVSGDFYWVKEVNDFKIILVADCTGHGVPGGFMSMLGIAFLNEIIKKPEVLTAAHLLNELRDYVIDALQQKGNIGDQADGMDIAVCVVNKKENKIQYSGAFNSVYIVSENNIENTNNKKLIKFVPKQNLNKKRNLFECKPDKMPIAHFIKMQSFKSVDIKLNKGDVVYLFSDGYPDQFGGEKGKKFNYKRFKTLLLEISDKPMNKQQQILENRLNQWKGKHFQVDDITVLGYRM
jgi:serine phosphatase RsbU (regulator of sigma subunit)